MREFSQVQHFIRGRYVPPGLRDQVFWCEECGNTAELVTWATWYVDHVWRGHTTNRQVKRESITVTCHGMRLRIEDPVDIYRVKLQVMYG